MIKLSKITQNYLLLLLFSPFLSYYTLTNFHVSSQFYMGILTIVYGIFYLTAFPGKIKIPSYAWWLLLFILYQFFVFKIDEYGFSYKILTAGLLYNIHVSAFFAIIVIYNSNFDNNFLKKAIALIKITVIIAAVVSIIQVKFYNFMDANPIWAMDEIGDTLLGNLYKDRRGSIFGFIDANELGLSYLPLLSVLIGFLLINRSKWYSFFLILGGVSAFLSNTRYVMIAFIIITFQILVGQNFNIKKFIKKLLYILIVAFVLYQLLIYLGYNIDEWFLNRLFEEGSIEQSTRYQAIRNFLIFFPENAILGTGGMTDAIKMASYSIGSSQIHVGYLSGLVYYGLIGSFFLFGFWFMLAKQLYKTAKHTNYWGSLFAFLIFLWANATLVCFHIFFYGIIFALVFDKYYSDQFTFQKEVI